MKRFRAIEFSYLVFLLPGLVCINDSASAQKVVESEFLKVTTPYSTAVEGEEITLTYELLKPVMPIIRVRAFPLNAIKTDSTASSFTFKVKNTLGADFVSFFVMLATPSGDVEHQVQLTLPITADHLTTLIMYTGDGSLVVNREFYWVANGMVRFEVGSDKKQCATVRIREMDVGVAARGQFESRTYHENVWYMVDFVNVIRDALITVRVTRATCIRKDGSESSFSLPAERMIVKAKFSSDPIRVPTAR